jgi:hypothetical protein
LQQGAPRFPRQRGLEGTDALRGDDRDALGLPRQAEELFIAGRLTLTDRGEVLVFIAEKQNLPEVALGILFHHGHAVEHGPLEVEFHHHPNRFGQTGIHANRKIQAAHRLGEATVRSRRQGRRSVVFIGAKRKPLTEGADGSGAEFGQEGQKIPVRYRKNH